MKHFRMSCNMHSLARNEFIKLLLIVLFIGISALGSAFKSYVAVLLKPVDCLEEDTDERRGTS